MNKPDGYWKNKDNRINAIKEFVEKSGKKPSELTIEYFEKNGLGGLLNEYYNCSPYLALKDANFVNSPLEMKNIPNGYWKSKKNRINAVKEMIKKSEKNPSEIIVEDFKKYNLMGLLTGHYKSSPYIALKEADIIKSPLEMEKVHNKYWKSKENRINAIKELVEKSGKKPSEITLKDFSNKGRGSILTVHNSSPYLALKEAGLVNSPLDMNNTPKNYWKSKENRINAIKELVEKSGKKPSEMTTKDFGRKGSMIINKYYKGSPYLALKDASYNVQPNSGSKFKQDNLEEALRAFGQQTKKFIKVSLYNSNN